MLRHCRSNVARERHRRGSVEFQEARLMVEAGRQEPADNRPVVSRSLCCAEGIAQEWVAGECVYLPARRSIVEAHLLRKDHRSAMGT